ncbi:hypothetical protein PVL29_024933 [Vitis rotundifolia]|nr:hypothetical protein PVL29_024933 [Vitis rotundifolia]
MTLVKEGKRRKRCGDKNLKLLHKMKMKSLLYIGVPSVESKSVEEPSECIVVEVLSSLSASLGNCFFLPEYCSQLKNPVTVSLLEYFLHPLGPLVLVYSFPIEESSEGFFVRESTAKSGLIANRGKDDGMWPFAAFTLQLHLMQIS